MPLRRALPLLALLTLAVGCLEPTPSGDEPPATTTPAGTTSTPSTPTPAAAPGPLAFRSLAKGQHSGHDEAGRLLIQDEAAWSAFWERHASIMVPPEPRPEVDFSKEVVAAALLGAKPNTCWSVRVTNATAEAARVVVEVTTYEPPQGAICGSAITHPHHVVALPKTGKAVEFSERTARGPPSPP